MSTLPESESNTPSSFVESEVSMCAFVVPS